MKRVHALANDGATLLSYEDSVLQQNLGRPGTNLGGTDRSRIAGGVWCGGVYVGHGGQPGSSFPSGSLPPYRRAPG